MLPREVLKWLQGLHLSISVRNPLREIANGYIIAEIFNRYYPQDIHMAQYDKGTSLERKLGNWSLLSKFFKKMKFEIPKEVIDGTVLCKPGAAERIVEQVYTILTNRQLKEGHANQKEFSDVGYQVKLPPYARATASYAIKNNIRPTELEVVKDNNSNHQKVEDIIAVQKNLTRLEKEMNPARYGRKPLGATGHPVKPAEAISVEALRRTLTNPPSVVRKLAESQGQEISVE